MSIVLPTASLLLDPAGVRLAPIVAHAKVVQEDGAHDLALVRVRGVDPTLPCFTSGTPVQLIYGWSPTGLETFYGYVNHVVPEHNHSTDKSIANVYSTVVCMGLSYPMRNASSAAWASVQASYLVQQKVAQYYLSGVVETDDPVWPQLSNPGVSDWKFLSGLADKLGYCLAVNQSTLKFMSVDQVVNLYSSTIPTFWTKLAAPQPSYANISSFTVLQGETSLAGDNAKLRHVVSGVDSRTGQSFTVYSDPPSPALAASSPTPYFQVFETDVPATNHLLASPALEGLSAKNRFYIQADADVAGNASITQAVPVLLLGLGSTHSGTWYVMRVVHEVTATNFVTHLKLGRDGTIDNGVRPQRPPEQLTGLGDVVSPPPSTVLVNGAWRSAYYALQAV